MKGQRTGSSCRGSESADGWWYCGFMGHVIADMEIGDMDMAFIVAYLV